MEKVLVMGGTGFLGRNLVRDLLSKNYLVTIVSRTDPTIKHKNLKHIKADMSKNLDFINNLDGFYKSIFHVVTATVPLTAEKNHIYDIEQNLIGFIRLLETLNDINFGTFIYVSSGGTVYGNPKKIPVSESSKCNPISSYGIVKLAAESYLRLYSSKFNFNHCILRISNPYGSDQLLRSNKTQGIIGILFEKIKKNISIDLYNFGKTQRDFIYIDDVIEAMILSMQHLTIGTFNIASQKSISLSELVEMMFKISGNKTKINLLPKRDFDVENIVLDCTKFKSLTGWEPKISLSEGLKKTFES